MNAEKFRNFSAFFEKMSQEKMKFKISFLYYTRNKQIITLTIKIIMIMNTTSFETQSILASEVINTIFSKEIQDNTYILDGMDFSAYELESVDPLFIDVLDFFDWLTEHSGQTLTLRIYDNGIHELVGDMYLEKDVVLAKDTRKYGTLSDLVIL